MSENLAGDVTLPLLVVEGVANIVPAADEHITGAVTLPLIQVVGTAQVTHSLSGGTSLPLVSVAATSQGSGIALMGDVALPAWGVVGTITHPLPTKHLVGATKLPMWKVWGREQHGARIYSLTGPVMKSGSQILVFVGPPNRVVAWSVPDGAGTLTPYTDYTDAFGRASCMYHPGDYEGDVIITVSYGA